MIAGVRGEGGLGMGAYTVRRAIRSSPASRSSVAATSAAGSPGHLVELDWELICGEPPQHRGEPVDRIVRGAREGAVSPFVRGFQRVRRIYLLARLHREHDAATVA